LEPGQIGHVTLPVEVVARVERGPPAEDGEEADDPDAKRPPEGAQPEKRGDAAQRVDGRKGCPTPGGFAGAGEKQNKRRPSRYGEKGHDQNGDEGAFQMQYAMAKVMGLDTLIDF